MTSSSIPVSRGAEFFSVNDVPLSVFRVGNSYVRRHQHDFHELVLVAQGSSEHDLFPPESDAPYSLDLNPGDLFLVPIGWSHRYGESENCEIFNVLVATEMLERWQPAEAPFGFFTAAYSRPHHWKLQRGEYEHLETLLQTIMRELTGRQMGFSIAAQAKMVEVLVWIERLNSRPLERRNPETQLAVSRAVGFMERNFANDIALHDIARVAHLSSHYFCEVFKNATGLSPGRYLLRLRMEHARYLILTTTQPITQVAREAGFADASYFARAFKAAYGTAPTRLRSAGR